LVHPRPHIGARLCLESQPERTYSSRDGTPLRISTTVTRIDPPYSNIEIFIFSRRVLAHLRPHLEARLCSESQLERAYPGVSRWTPFPSTPVTRIDPTYLNIEIFILSRRVLVHPRPHIGARLCSESQPERTYSSRDGPILTTLSAPVTRIDPPYSNIEIFIFSRFDPSETSHRC